MTKWVFWEAHNTEQLVLRSLQEGVVLGDSDTVLGLYALCTYAGFCALNELKGRFEKPYLLLVGNKQKALSYIDTPPSALLEKIMDACWPGPLTLICRARKDLPDYVQSKTGTIALRVPDHTGLRLLLAQCDALFSTSANKAGFPVAEDIEQIDDDILRAVSCCVLNQNRSNNGIASTILDCTGESIRIIREGAYSIALIEQQSGIVIFPK